MADQQVKPTATIEIYAMINSEGEYVATHDEDRLTEEYGECVGGTPTDCRSIKLSLTVPLPTYVEVSGTIPDTTDDAAEIALTVEA